MRQFMMTVTALSALFVTFAGKAHAEVNYPWCIIGDTRGLECVFSSREQCAQDGRNRGFGGQCIKNPAYKPGQPPTVSGPVAKRAVSQAARPSRAVTAAQQAMQECRQQYGGSGGDAPHGYYSKDQQSAWVEACFKEKTGLYPGQANVNLYPYLFR
jgi:Protein of unknown function (DUF3551)